PQPPQLALDVPHPAAQLGDLLVVLAGQVLAEARLLVDEVRHWLVADEVGSQPDFVSEQLIQGDVPPREPLLHLRDPPDEHLLDLGTRLQEHQVFRWHTTLSTNRTPPAPNGQLSSGGAE